MTAAPYNVNPELAYEGGQIWSYLKNRKVYWCPTDKTNASANPYWTIRPNKQSTYIWNGAVSGYGALGGRTYRLGAFNQAAYFVWEPDETNYYQHIPGQSCYNDASSTTPAKGTWGRRPRPKGGHSAGLQRARGEREFRKIQPRAAESARFAALRSGQRDGGLKPRPLRILQGSTRRLGRGRPPISRQRPGVGIGTAAQPGGASAKKPRCACPCRHGRAGGLRPPGE
jgi:hypothetical protein